MIYPCPITVDSWPGQLVKLWRLSLLLEALPQGVQAGGFPDDREPVPAFELGSSPRDHDVGPAPNQGDQGALRQKDILERPTDEGR